MQPADSNAYVLPWFEIDGDGVAMEAAHLPPDADAVSKPGRWRDSSEGHRTVTVIGYAVSRWCSERSSGAACAGGTLPGIDRSLY
jgi:hypothetical protein